MKSNQTREWIISCATNLFMTKGYDAISIHEILKAANCSVSLFYYYFSSKDELFNECLHNFLKNYEETINTLLKNIDFDSPKILFDIFINITIKNKDDVFMLLIHLGYLAYDQRKQTAFIPNEEIRGEFVNAVEENKWNELYDFENKSNELLEATLDLECDIVAEKIEQIHSEYTSVIEYNNENSLSSVLAIAYLSAMQYYFKPVREMPVGRGFADFVFIPKPQYLNSYPALVVELKWNKNVSTALAQIKERKYPQSLMEYTGDILLVGINYDKKNKAHECEIEQYEI